jgi:Tfp pilus assembly protein PilP
MMPQMSHEDLEQYVKGLEAEVHNVIQNLGGFQQYVEDKIAQLFQRTDEILATYNKHMSNPEIPSAPHLPDMPDVPGPTLREAAERSVRKYPRSS